MADPEHWEVRTSIARLAVAIADESAFPASDDSFAVLEAVEQWA